MTCGVVPIKLCASIAVCRVMWSVIVINAEVYHNGSFVRYVTALGTIDLSAEKTRGMPPYRMSSVCNAVEKDI